MLLHSRKCHRQNVDTSPQVGQKGTEFCPQKPLSCRGSLLGVCWRSLPGGGFLVSRSWTFSGPNVIYLYPDCRFKIGFLKMDLCQTLLSQKDSSGRNFSKLWCGTSQALWGPRLRRVGSGLGEFFLSKSKSIGEFKRISHLTGEGAFDCWVLVTSSVFPT